jgi:hypothetical protein
MRWLAVLLYLTSAAMAQSHPPPHADVPKSSDEQSPTAKDKKQSETDQRGTDISPLIVKIQNPNEAQQKANQEAENNERRLADKDMFKIGVASIIVGAAQAIFLFITFLVIAYVGVFQLRAYINPTLRKIQKFSLTERIIISIKLKNDGETPAHAMEVQAVIFVGALPLADDAKLHEPKEPEGLGRHSTMTLFSRGETIIDVVADDVLTPIEITALKAKIWVIYIAGEVRYKDVFRFFKRTSQFCVYVDPDSAVELIGSEEGTMPAPNIVNFTTAHVWNRAS